MGKLVTENPVESPTEKPQSDLAWMWLMLVDFVLVIAGGILIYCAWNANGDLMEMITSLIEKHYSQQGSSSKIGSYVLGLLSGGTLTLVPIWQVRIGYFAGFILAYLGLAGLTYHSRKKKLRVIFTRSYWTSFKASANDV